MAPKIRLTPLERTVADIVLAVNRKHGKSDYLPCIAWNKTAAILPQSGIGDCVDFKGRIQSRKHHKGIAYEVSVNVLIQ